MARRPQRARGRAARWGAALRSLSSRLSPSGPPAPVPARGERSRAGRAAACAPPPWPQPSGRPRAADPCAPSRVPGCGSGRVRPILGRRALASAEDARPEAERLPATLGSKRWQINPWQPTQQGWGTAQLWTLGRMRAGAFFLETA